jgi:peptidyl-prolyl cis-trans isomerase A (cyclophilin A)
MRSLRNVLFTITLGFSGTVGCTCNAPPEPDAVTADPGVRTAATQGGSRPTGAASARGGDPKNGRFTLADATNGLTGAGPLVAVIDTSKGRIECTLFEDKAPNTVANFVGLARGTRPWKGPKTGAWVERPAYDATTFHRIIDGFMIQGGDANGDGSGEPGYVIKDEIWPGAKHDRAGQLCMANRGKNTNGAQFFITDAKAEHLDGGYTIFGQCNDVAVIHAIATAPKGPQDRPKTAIVINTVRVARRGSALDVPQ